jgi:branched-chain amino acid aminotransferase
MHRFLLHNDQVLDAAARDLAAGQVGLMNGWGVFSTIRIAEGVLFAFERHWDRMRRDAQRPDASGGSEFRDRCHYARGCCA